MTRWAQGITAIRLAELGPSPASVNRETGVMYVNPNFRDRQGRKLTADQWYYIMLHEQGHLKEQTKDERTADAWADRHYKGSLKESVYALSDVLSFNKPEDRLRVIAQLQRAQRKDGKVVQHYAFTGTTEPTRKMSYQHKLYDPNYNEYFGGRAYQYDDGHEYFLKKLGNWIKDKAAPAVGKIAGSLLGTGGSGTPTIIQSGGGDIGAILAAQEAARQREAAERAEREAASRQTMMYVGIGAAVFVAIIVLVLVLKAKK
jgi:hypothetical protein